MSKLLLSYTEQKNEYEVMLLYLLLVGGNVKKIKDLQTVTDSRSFGTEITKIVALTSEYVNVPMIEQEISEIRNINICSLQTYEYFSKSDTVYAYTPAIADKPLLINDMDILSNVMVITDDVVISSNEANSIMDSDNLGFDFFKQYVVKSEVTVGQWHIKWDNETFSVSYITEDKNKNLLEDVVYYAVNFSKAYSYRLVLFIISKAAQVIDEWDNDNFKATIYTKQKGDD